MFASDKNQKSCPDMSVKNRMISGGILFPQKTKLVFCRWSKLFKSIKIDHKALKETLEITFWK
jgi:hypothetical protein